jgi:hypothetical protein
MSNNTENLINKLGGTEFTAKMSLLSTGALPVSV